MPSASQPSQLSRRLGSALPFGFAKRAALFTGLIWIFALAAGASTAAAKDLFVLDSQAASPGNVVEDGSGSAYVGWIHKSGSATIPDPPMFCKVPAGGTCTNPITLPIPGATSTLDEVDGVFPVLGAGSTVYVVAPRYDDNVVVVWTSTNGGESFNAGTIDPKGYSGKTDPSNALLSGKNLLIGATNPGAGFSSTPAEAGGLEKGFEFEFPGEGGVGGSDLGTNGAGNLVDTYWNLSTETVPDRTLHFYRYSGKGSVDEEKNWEGPFLVGNGEEPRVTSGAGGLFMASLDYGGASTEANTLEVREYGGTEFGPPQTLTSTSAAGLFEAGSIAESPDGSHVALVWPATSGRNPVMDLFTSSNSGASFGAASDIAPIGNSYGDDNNEVAIGNNGQGWLTYLDEGGLHLGDLNPSTAGPTPTPTPTPTRPPTYTGKTHTTSTAVGSNFLTLKVPGECLQALQPFYVGVGKKARHKIAKALRSKMKVAKVTFSFDGQKKTLKKKPFRWLITPGALTPGKKYTVKARVTALVKKNGHTKRVIKTLKGQVSVC